MYGQELTLPSYSLSDGMDSPAADILHNVYAPSMLPEDTASQNRRREEELYIRRETENRRACEACKKELISGGSILLGITGVGLLFGSQAVTFGGIVGGLIGGPIGAGIGMGLGGLGTAGIGAGVGAIPLVGFGVVKIPSFSEYWDSCCAARIVNDSESESESESD